MNNIYLIGFMGAGKTTVGKIAAELCNMRFVDTDDMIVEKKGMSIPEIFDSEGEEAFRRIETEVIKSLGDESRLIVSCGGGAAANEVNVPLLKQGGRVVYLKTSPRKVFERVGESDNRPLLNGRRSVSGIEELMLKRIPKYERAADIIIDTDDKSPEEIAKLLFDL
ncbi:MAG: shikimate kinase [Lachnospiraceae bacterium]|nr:shikimate kinase [Lachnospiraceae bacterium]